ERIPSPAGGPRRGGATSGVVVGWRTAGWISRRWLSSHGEKVMIADDLVERVLERMSDAFVCLDLDGRYVYVNQRAGELGGRGPASLIGKQIWAELPEKAGLTLRRAIEAALAEKQPVQLEEYDAASGKWLENRIHPDPDGLAIFFNDVTARHLAEE